MADTFGLIGALTQGINSGVESYQSAKKQALENKYKQQTLQSALIEKGQMQDDDGNVVIDPNSVSEAGFKRQQLDPNSDVSKNYGILTKGVADKAGLNGIVPEGRSAKEYEGYNPILKPAESGQYSMQGRQATSDRVAASNDIKKQSLGIRRDEQASRAVDKVHNDKRVVALTQQLDQLERGRGILDQPTITNQEFNDYQQEIQSALSGASGGALGKLERTEYKTTLGQWAALKQQISGAPEDAVPKPIVERLKVLADHTKDMMQRHRADRAESLARNYRSNSAANDEMGKAIKSYALPEESQASGLMDKPKTGAGLLPAISPEDQQAIQWAKANASDPRAAKILQMHGVK